MQSPLLFRRLILWLRRGRRSGGAAAVASGAIAVAVGDVRHCGRRHPNVGVLGDARVDVERVYLASQNRQNKRSLFI